jgi:hypothetical protein
MCYTTQTQLLTLILDIIRAYKMGDFVLCVFKFINLIYR